MFVLDSNLDVRMRIICVLCMQERLMKKLGPNAYPFYFELPPHCPASVTLQPAPGDTGKPCGVDYELKAFVGETQDDKPHKRWIYKQLLSELCEGSCIEPAAFVAQWIESQLGICNVKAWFPTPAHGHELLFWKRVMYANSRLINTLKNQNMYNLKGNEKAVI